MPPLAPGAAMSDTPASGLRVRLDVLLWLAIVAVAAALRFARLDALPLTLEESGRAAQAFEVANGNVADGWSGDLLAAVTSYVFRIEDSELLLRLAPAVAGAAMVAAVWLCGRVIGRTGALVAAALLAFSPLALLLSRTAVPFAAGGLLSVLMVAALFAYVREPRVTAAFLLALALGLAPAVDAVATTSAIAVVAFVAVELAFRREGEVGQAWRAFRHSPAHWLSALIVVAAALQLGVTHFGTEVRGLSLAGVDQWADMFDTPRDSREPEFQLAVLLAYEWPLLLAGGLAFGYFAARLLRREALSAAQRFLLLWTALAALVVVLAMQREAGQLLILVVPLALLAGLAANELLPSLDWAVLRRWWPAAALTVVLVAYAAFLATDWSQDGITTTQRVYLVLAAGGAGVLLSMCFSLLGRSAAPVAVLGVVVLAGAFLAHTDLTLTRRDERAEFAIDMRTSERIGQFRETLREVLGRRAGPALIDPSLAEPLAWYLRDLPVAFGAPDTDAAAAVVPLGAEVPGFTTAGGTWRLAEGWYPTDLKPLPLWRWLVLRERYGSRTSVETVDVEIMVPRP
jgi:predicted membrane-bound mannosyltransferase